MSYVRKPIEVIRTPKYVKYPETYTDIGCKFTIVREPTLAEADKIILEDEAYAPFLDYRNQPDLEDFLNKVSSVNLPVYIRTTHPIQKKHLEAIKNHMSTIDYTMQGYPDKDTLACLRTANNLGLHVIVKIHMDSLSEADIMQLIYILDYTISKIVLISRYTDTEKYKAIERRLPLLKSSVIGDIILWKPKDNFIGLWYRKYIKIKGIFIPEKEEWLLDEKV